MNEAVLDLPQSHAAPKKSHNWITFLAVFVLAVVGAYALQLTFATRSMKADIAERQERISIINEAIKSMQATDKVSDRLIANEILQKINTSKTEWSPLVEEIMKIESDGVTFTSVASGKDNQVVVSAKAPSYLDVGTILKTIDANPVLQSSFVDSAVSQKTSSRSLNNTSGSASQNFVQFQMKFNFAPQEIQSKVPSQKSP